ncbi:nucleoside phosphorylase domain-containing protein [Bisporella sp. PMI_857]|nr:nucleoside phosphorylase domain-containing protein [Bisporella sp. PMI_857]
MTEKSRQYTHGDYTVGWICALPETELVAAGAMLDEEHPVLPAADPQDTNSYLLGKIGSHNVVIACLPAEMTGKVSAATVAKDMVRSFKAVRFGLMVGIGGGAPYYGVIGNNNARSSESEDEDSEEEDFEDIKDIRLGDVVISLHSKSAEAVVQYDFGKSVQEKEFIHTGGKLNKPPNIVLNAVAMLKGQHERKGHKIRELLSKMVSENPRMATKFQYPGSAKDRLFKSDVVHVDGKKSCKACCGPSDVNLVKRKDRYDSAPSLHYGTIGSADQVIKDATLRDNWAKKENIICFEMEAAGLMDSFPCLVIRGICDYADSHKNKIWQPYAAATAAAYAKELLLVIPGQPVMDLPLIEQIGNKFMQQLTTLRQSDEEKQCLQAFRTTDYETQKNLNPKREEGTCLWCLDDERFRNWRDKSTSCLLWVTADPGCGKSVLSRALVDDPELKLLLNDTTICYFFFKDTSEDQRSPISALAALLHQLFTSEIGAKVIRHALPAFQENKDKVSQYFEVMWGIVQDIALDPGCGKIIFLLDALDECESSKQQSLIEKLKGLERMQIRHVKFFITSRPYWDIEKGFDTFVQI